jgi:ketosteroid isomerase-like protein
VDAFDRQDIDSGRALFAPGGVLHVLPPHELAGDYHGFDGLLDRLKREADAAGPTFRSDVHDVLASEAHAVVLSRLHGRRGGREQDWTQVAVYHIARGRVSEIWVQEGPA